jgi:hypothetical protein
VLRTISGVKLEEIEHRDVANVEMRVVNEWHNMIFDDLLLDRCLPGDLKTCQEHRKRYCNIERLWEKVDVTPDDGEEPCNDKFLLVPMLRYITAKKLNEFLPFVAVWCSEASDHSLNEIGIEHRMCAVGGVKSEQNEIENIQMKPFLVPKWGKKRSINKKVCGWHFRITPEKITLNHITKRCLLIRRKITKRAMRILNKLRQLDQCGEFGCNHLFLLHSIVKGAWTATQI